MIFYGDEVCLYVYMYICIYVYMYICIYVYMYICIYVYVYMYICIYVYMYICIYVYMYICMYECMYICTDGKKLKVVDKFTYLGSTINRFCSLDDEIALRLKKATGAFSALKHRVWSQKGLKKSTKLVVNSACVLTCLLYSCETWVVYRRHLKQLERFHQ